MQSGDNRICDHPLGDETRVETPKQKWARENRDKVRATAMDYYHRHKKQRLAYSAKWWKDHPDKLRAKWRRRNASPSGREKAKRHRLKHAAEIKAKKSAHQKARRAYYNAYHKQWRTRNKAHFAKKSRIWSRAATAKRRMLIKAATVNLKKIEQWMTLVTAGTSAVCYWCQNQIPISMIHFDHIIALSKGGPHSVENLCVSCATCNLSKHDKAVSEWIRSGQQFLEL